MESAANEVESASSDAPVIEPIVMTSTSSSPPIPDEVDVASLAAEVCDAPLGVAGDPTADPIAAATSAVTPVTIRRHGRTGVAVKPFMRSGLPHERPDLAKMPFAAITHTIPSCSQGDGSRNYGRNARDGIKKIPKSVAVRWFGVPMIRSRQALEQS